ncbi:hypothetical protein Mmc1_1568 [Magnetococcus marinus MC-1]|uniref:Uncharacterized protein n=1 Tax=Magnetococcus marinus (strain ATCC BAA-1437 / JCM 17883 / MC-1) TaxID=156889 RepID=A0L7Y4_MAGMM|nr:hypothetical protein [Magnetococcus marinus]ABK44077.1 hypothetical protein Mmc1_1568 [Magnetococcus marinus MC-1]
MNTIQNMPAGVSGSTSQQVARSPKAQVAQGSGKSGQEQVKAFISRQTSQAAKQAAQSGKQAFQRIMPEPPSPGEMQQARDEATRVARRIYANNPVRQFTEGSRVADAYKRQQQGVNISAPPPSLADAFA